MVELSSQFCGKHAELSFNPIGEYGGCSVAVLDVATFSLLVLVSLATLFVALPQARHGQKRQISVAQKLVQSLEALLLLALGIFVLVVFILQELSGIDVTFPLEGNLRESSDAIGVSAGGVASSILQLVAWLTCLSAHIVVSGGRCTKQMARYCWMVMASCWCLCTVPRVFALTVVIRTPNTTVAGLVLAIVAMALQVFLCCLGVIGVVLETFSEERGGVYEPLLAGGEGAGLEQLGGKCPHEDTRGILHWISALLFTYMNPVFRVGYKRPLDRGDIYDLPAHTKAAEIDEIIEDEWTRQLKKKHPRLWVALGRGFWSPFIGAFFLKTTYDVLQFVGPQVLQAITKYLDAKHSKDNESADPPFWATFVPEDFRGWYYVLILGAVSFLNTIMLHQYFLRVMTVGLNMRSAIVLQVYKKALKLAPDERQQSSAGKVVNLMSSDATRLMDMTTYLMILVSGPVQIVIALVSLWQLLGPSTLAGIAVMVFNIPLNGFLSKFMRSLQIRIMGIKDKRLNLQQEMLNAMKLVKCNAWEPTFEERIGEVRNKEIRTLTVYSFLRSGLTVLFSTVPTIVSLAAFGVYIATGGNLTSSTAFTALSLFNILRFPLIVTPLALNNLIEAGTSLKRIQEFLRLREVDDHALERSNSHTGSNKRTSNGSKGGDKRVLIEQGSFSWQAGEGNTVLRDVNIEIGDGDFVAVIGPVGSGKSSLLHAIIGELYKQSGRAVLNGSVGFVAQTPFILNATLKENILFGREMDEQLYKEVLHACCLEADIELLPGGDETEIGESGINLSGGQRQRVSLARAVYRQADIYVLDDVLSAVDAHVGQQIYQRCITGMLASRTRILVTHGLQYLSRTDMLICMKNGTLDRVGTYSDLTTKGSTSDLAGMLARYDADVKSMKTSPSMEKVNEMASKPEGDSGKSDVKKTQEQNSPAPSNNGNGVNGSVKDSQKKGKLTELEKMERGVVKKEVYMQYAAAAGGIFPVAILILFFIGYAAASVFRDWWLSHWTYLSNKTYNDGRLKHDSSSDQTWYFLVYTFLCMGCIVILLVRALSSYVLSIKAARNLHEALLKGVLGAPMSFFHTTPTGRIMNRFSQDTYTVDERLCDTLSSFTMQTFQVVATIAAIGYATPYFLIVVPFILIFYRIIQNYYITSSRELKRLDNVARSPIYSHFTETMNGAITIRAYGDERRFALENQRKLDVQQGAYYWGTVVANRWLAVRLESTGTLIVTFAALFAIVGNGISSSLAGLSISYALQVTQSLNWVTRMSSDKESQIVSVERMSEYASIAQEPPPVIAGKRPPKDWPAR